ncbi:hypothetical protein [Agromyces salentinus]|uniref:DUF1707 domain-containing protein n=1 Tax=Agromyces salentinus TaxID=269421 RepID=A0ABN2MVT2_9MICO|nr:hypothetical protein [Agromyces salentinus]
MPEPDDDLARLQRIAFGSGSSEAERADAARELDARRAAASVGEPGPGDPTVEHDHVAATPTGTDAATVALAPGEPPTSAGLRWLRLVIGVGAATLVVGLLAGWQLGASQVREQSPAVGPSATPYDGPRTLAEYLDTLPRALESRAAEVFSRPLTADDVPDGLSMYDAATGSPEYRLLATTKEGVRMYASRDDLDLCLTVTTPAGAGIEATGMVACTEDGLFPEAGLALDASAVREVTDADGSTSFVLTSFLVTWKADGSLSFGPPQG